MSKSEGKEKPVYVLRRYYISNGSRHKAHYLIYRNNKHLFERLKRGGYHLLDYETGIKVWLSGL